MVSACERSTLFDGVQACVTMALVCVTMVLACEIPHTRYPADPGTTPAMQTSDLPPKYGTDDKPGGVRVGSGHHCSEHPTLHFGTWLKVTTYTQLI